MIAKLTHRYTINDDESVTVDCNRIGKITGTTLSAVVGLNPWQTPFSIACRLLGIYDDDLSDNVHIKAGKVLEPVIMGYLDKSGRLKNTQAEEIFGERTGKHIDWEQDFEDPVYGGHIDGLTPDGHIVECKTTTNPSLWQMGTVPEHYWIQASLYARFMGTDTIHFTVGILTQSELSNPYTFIPTEDNVKVITVGVHPEIDTFIELGRQWYDRYLSNGITPCPTEHPSDKQILNHLKWVQADEESIRTLLVDYESKLAVIDELSARVKELESETENMKKNLISYIQSHDNCKVVSNRYRYQLTTSTRSSADTDAMKKDGIFDRYSKKSTYTSLRRYAV